MWCGSGSYSPGIFVNRLGIFGGALDRDFWRLGFFGGVRVFWRVLGFLAYGGFWYVFIPISYDN